MSRTRDDVDLREQLLDPDPAPGVAAVVVSPAGIEVAVSGVCDTSTGAPVTEATTFHACSMAKLVTAVGVVRLVEEDRLDLDLDVRELLGEAVPAGPGGRGPTVRELLAHHGGLEDPPGAFEPTDAPSPSAAEILTGRTSACAGPVTLTRPPGSGFSYSDLGYVLLERAVEVATGEAFGDALHRLVVSPLGLASTAFWTGDDTVGSGEDTVGSGEDTVGSERAHVVRQVRRTAASGHDPQGRPVAGGRIHYPGLAASALWTTAGDLGLLLQDLSRSLAGQPGTVLSTQSARALVEGSGHRGVGLGAFVMLAARGPCLMSQGWGIGFQSQARIYPDDGGAVAVLVNMNPGAPQEASVVGRTVDRVARLRGWEA